MGPENSHVDIELGPALRRVRRERGLSLARVAAETGISRSLLSLIETGKSDITLGRLARLAALYGIRVGDLLPDRHAGEPVVVRRKDRPHLYSREEALDVYLLVPDTDRAMMPAVGVFEPGGAVAEFATHAGEEFVLVLEGMLRIELDGSEPVVLERGDSAYYRATRRHRWSNVGDGLLRVVAVTCPPNW
jgi:transcriptional regulator with XRE-family HTH domain